MAHNWLDDLIIVNENNDPNVAGDVQVYRNEGDMGRQLDHWYVNDVAHLALTGTGDKATLGLQGELVIVERREPLAEGETLLRQWLTKTAQHLLSVRTERARKGKIQVGTMEAQGVLPNSIEGLIACIGFMK